MRISDWSSDVCSSDLGSTGPNDINHSSTTFSRSSPTEAAPCPVIGRVGSTRDHRHMTTRRFRRWTLSALALAAAAGGAWVLLHDPAPAGAGYRTAIAAVDRTSVV